MVSAHYIFQCPPTAETALLLTLAIILQWPCYTVYTAVIEAKVFVWLISQYSVDCDEVYSDFRRTEAPLKSHPPSSDLRHETVPVILPPILRVAVNHSYT